jgi:flagellar biosynthesis/type III secretory pathway protein FliH
VDEGAPTLAEEFYESLHEGQRSTRIELADNALIAGGGVVVSAEFGDLMLHLEYML